MRKKYTFAADLRTLESLADDLAAVSDGSFNFADVKNAPVLKHVSIVHRPMQCLEGVVEGHPRLPDGRRIVTSQLWAACDAHALFARTLNRWYRIEKVVDLWGR